MGITVIITPVKLIFDYPSNLTSLEGILATKAYEAIWQQDGDNIVQAMNKITGLQFKQSEVHVKVHHGQSMSGKDGVPMRLSINNDSLNEKRNALIHELGHRLLFGNGLYSQEEDSSDADEIRVFLFQGDVIQDVYGIGAYNFWIDNESNTYNDDHRRLIDLILRLSKEERREEFNRLVKFFK